MPEGSRGEFRPEPRREREEDTPAKTSEDDRRREAPKTQKEPVADQKKQPEQPGGPMFWGDPGW